MKSEKRIWNEIVHDFDWERVRAAMAAFNLYWQMPDGRRVPTIEEMQAEVKGFLTRILASPDTSMIGSGGFELRRSEDGKVTGFTLTFILAESISYSA